MKKLIFITVLILVFAFSLTGCFNKEEKKENGEQKFTQEQSKIKKDKEESFFGSMKDLLSGGYSRRCTYEDSVDNGKKVIGTLYIADNKAKSEIEMVIEGKKSIIHNLIKDDWIYIWSDILPMATKMNIKEKSEGEKFDVNKEVMNLEKETKYKCHSWIKDNSKFILPNNIEFHDLSKETVGLDKTVDNIDIEEIKKNKEEANDSICKLCEMAPDVAAQEQCKIDAGCE